MVSVRTNGIKTWWNLLPLVLTMAIVVAALWRDARVLCAWPIAVGVDGYYYVLQVNQILSSGHLYYSSRTPIPFFVMAVVTRIVGDTILGVKCTAMLFAAVLYFGIFGLIMSVGYSRWLTALGVGLAAFSSLHFYLISEFINNLAGLSLLVISAWITLLAANTRRRSLFFGAGVCFLLASLCHKSILPLSLLLVALFLFSRFVLGLPRRKRVGVVIIFLCVTFAGFAALAAQPIFHLPTWLSVELLAWPHLPFSRVALPEKLILAVVIPAVLIQLVMSNAARPGLRSVLLCSVALFALLVSLNPFLAYHIGWGGISARLSGLSFISVAILVPGVIAMLMKTQRVAVLYATAIITPLFLLSITWPLPAGLQPAYLTDRANIIESLASLAPMLPADSVIVAEHGTQFVATFATGLRGKSQLHTNVPASNVYWILVGVRPSLSNSAVKLLTQSPHGSLVILISNDALKALVESISDTDKRVLFAANRHLYQSCLSAGLATQSGECVRLR